MLQWTWWHLLWYLCKQSLSVSEHWSYRAVRASCSPSSFFKPTSILDWRRLAVHPRFEFMPMLTARDGHRVHILLVSLQPTSPYRSYRGLRMDILRRAKAQTKRSYGSLTEVHHTVLVPASSSCNAGHLHWDIPHIVSKDPVHPVFLTPRGVNCGPKVARLQPNQIGLVLFSLADPNRLVLTVQVVFTSLTSKLYYIV